MTTPLARQWLIVAKLAHGGASVRELAELHNVTQKTIRRDLKLLRESGFAVSETVMPHGKKVWTIPDTIPRH